jgi:uncharacterized protein YggE
VLSSSEQARSALDAATRAEAHPVQGVRWGLRDEAAARLRAIGSAVRQARAEAYSLASALAMTLGSSSRRRRESMFMLRNC